MRKIMSFQELSKKIEELGTLNAQFRNLTDRRLDEIEKRGSADPLTIQQIDRLNHQLDVCQSELESLKAINKRPAVEGIKTSYHENSSYQTAFSSYLRSGSVSDLESVQYKSLSSQTSDRDGGYLITSRMSESIFQFSDSESPMRKLATVTTVSGDALELIEDPTEELCGWTEDMNEILERTSSSSLSSKKIINVHELYAQPKATQKMLDDPRVDVEKWLADRLAYAFNTYENKAFIHGDGLSKPRGILTYTDGDNRLQKIFTNESGKINADSLIHLFFSLKSKYTNNAKFLLSREALQQIRLLKNSNGQYLWQAGLSESTPANILGAEFLVSSEMPDVGSGKTPIAFGDFKQGYQIVDRQGIRILRDPYTLKPFVKFYSTKRLGGDVIDSNAIKLLQVS
jgi:HK97 family phage major capsid protein